MAEKSVSKPVDQRFEDLQGNLDFKDAPHTNEIQSEKSQTHVFTNFPHGPNDSDNEEKIENEKSKTASYFSIEYYQSFFDVDTKQVLTRIAFSMVPSSRTNFLRQHIRPNPDLYGPFWICTTLVLSIAISGNLANYFAAYHHSASFQWQYDFHKVSTATFVIYIYWLLMPTILIICFRWRGVKTSISFTELICLYGYSLSIYIPISILWLVPLTWLRWSLVVLGMLLSGSVLVLTLWPSFFKDTRKVALILTIFVVIMHGLLAVGFMTYFFSAVPPLDVPSPIPADEVTKLPLKLSSNQSNLNSSIINKLNSEKRSHGLGLGGAKNSKILNTISSKYKT